MVEGAKLQILSMAAAVLAGRRTPAAQALLHALLAGRAAPPGAPGGRVLGGRERLPLRDALYANAAFSMAQDYDDYLFAGHTGHSTVLASLLAAEAFGLSGRELLLGQVVANEVLGRMGASVLLGPLNGQLWSFLHAAGAAIVLGKAQGLDVDALESALGLALLQPPMPLWRGFFGSEGKLLLAAMPAAHGADAVELAQAGVPGAHGILDGDAGFVARFSPRPIWGAFTGLGDAWLSDTLCFKPYPGCAYLDTTLDAALEIAAHHRPDPRRIARVDVAANVLTVGMDALSRPHLRGAASDPVTLCFSVPYAVAAALSDGELTPRQLTRDRIGDPRLWDLAGRVFLAHDAAWSKRMQETSVIALAGGSAGKPEIDLAGVDLSGFEMSFGATVTVHLDDGRRLERAQAVPLGAAGRPREETREIVEAKFAREAAHALPEADALRAALLVGELEDATPAEVRELLARLTGAP